MIDKNKVIIYRNELLHLFKGAIAEIRKCPRCRKNKMLERLLNSLITKSLYDKRWDENRKSPKKGELE
jgi:hypothetical protein